MFELDARLAADTFRLGRFVLSEVLLMNDARYPWIILVPRRPALSEIYQLSLADQQQLLAESSFVATQLSELLQADKMNIAALGNVVPQLHLHHVARFKTDASWPAPVWGRGVAEPYTDDQRQLLLRQLTDCLADFLQDGQ